MNIWQSQTAASRPSPAPTSANTDAKKTDSPALDWITKLASEALGAPLALLFEQSSDAEQPRLLAAHGISRQAVRWLPSALPEWLFDPMDSISGEVAYGSLRGGSYVCVPVGRPGAEYRAVLCVADNTARPGGISATERESLLLLAKLAWQQISSGKLNLDLNAMVSGDQNSIIRRAAIERLRFALRDTAPAELCAA